MQSFLMTNVVKNSTIEGYDYDKINIPEVETSYFPGSGTFLKSKGTCSNQLTIFRQYGNKWKRIDFPAGKTTIKIGSQLEKNDIVIDSDENVDSIHIAINYLGNKIFITERGKNNITYINGNKTPQAILEDKNSALLVVGKTTFIIKPKNSAAPKDAAGQNTYLIKTLSEEFKLEFGRCYLLGSNSICDLPIKGDEFIGIIIPYERNIYLFPITGLRINGDEISGLQPCRLTSQSLINGLDISVYIPQEMFDDNIYNFPSFSFLNLKLIEIRDDEKQGDMKIRIPKEGSSFLIGRTNADNGLQIESPLISRKHAQVIVYRNFIMVEDCYSTNGTYINGEKISRKMMKPGDFLSFGDKTFLLTYSLAS